MDVTGEIRDIASAATIARQAMQMGASQEEGELREAIELVIRQQPQVLVELGCDRGGTLYAWRRICPAVYGITWEQNADSDGQPCVPHGARIKFADTHSTESRQWLDYVLAGAKVDVLVVDGDHHLDGVIQDLEDYGPLVRPGGLIMMHDIIPEKYPEVHVWQLWPRLRDRYRTSEIGRSFGWGIIHVQPGDVFTGLRYA